MKLLIDIPKEFEQHFQADRFEDSLHRLSADAHLLAGLYEQETVFMLSEAFKNAVSVPKHGRLIDADALYEEALKRSETKDGYYNCPDSVISCYTIDNAPTIIPASEEGE